MKPSAWIITAVLVVLAAVGAWFFGLDARHAVVLVGAAVAAGVANGVLEAVDVQRAVLPPLPEPDHGLADVQALEFSLSSAEPGTRAVLEVHTLAAAVAAAHPATPRSRRLDAFIARRQPPAMSHRDLRSLVDELERIMGQDGAGSGAATVRPRVPPDRPGAVPTSPSAATHQENP